MNLVQLSIRNFGGIHVAEVEFGPGLNVLYGPNDLGKSTLLASIRAVLLLPIGSRGREPYVAWDGTAAPKVELVIQTDGRRYWRIKKIFASGTKGRASLESSLDGETFLLESHSSKEVDNKLRELLRWGIPGPEGKGAPRGIPVTFLTSTLLADQEGVADLFSQHLGAFKDTSDREMLTEALQILAQPDEFTHALEIAELRTSEVFSKTGRARRGAQSPLAALREQVLEAEREVEEAFELYQSGESVRKRIQELAKQLDGLKSEVAKARNQVKDLREKKSKAVTYQEISASLHKGKEKVNRLQNAKNALVSAQEKESSLTEDVKGASILLEEAKTKAEAALHAREKAREELEEAKLLPDPVVAYEKKNQLWLEDERTAQNLINRASHAESLNEQVSNIQKQITLLEEALPGERELLTRIEMAEQCAKEILAYWRTFSNWAHSGEDADISNKLHDISILIEKEDDVSANERLAYLRKIDGLLKELKQLIGDRDAAQQALEDIQKRVISSEHAFHQARNDLDKSETSDSLQPKLEKRLLELDTEETTLNQRAKKRELINEATKRAESLQKSVTVFENKDLTPLREKEHSLKNRMREIREEQADFNDLGRYLEWEESARLVSVLEDKTEHLKKLQARESALRAEAAAIQEELEHLSLPGLNQLSGLRNLRESMRVAEARMLDTPASSRSSKVLGISLLIGTCFSLVGGSVLVFSTDVEVTYSIVGLGLGIAVTLFAVTQILRSRSETSRRIENLEADVRRLHKQWQIEGQAILDATKVGSLDELEELILNSKELSTKARELLREAEGLSIQIANSDHLQAELVIAREQSSKFEQDIPIKRRSELEVLSRGVETQGDLVTRQETIATELREMDDALKEVSLILAKKETQLEGLKDKLAEAEQSFEELHDPNEAEHEADDAIRLREIKEERVSIKNQLRDLVAVLDANRAKAKSRVKQHAMALDKIQSAHQREKVVAQRTEGEANATWKRLQELILDEIASENIMLETESERKQRASFALAGKEAALEHLSADLKTKLNEITELNSNLGAPNPEAARLIATTDLERIQAMRDAEAKRMLMEQERISKMRKVRNSEFEETSSQLTESYRLRDALINQHETLVSQLSSVQGEIRTRNEEFDQEELSSASAEVADLEAQFNQSLPSDTIATDQELEEADRRVKLAEAALREVQDQKHHERGALAQIGGGAAMERWKERVELKMQLEEREREMELEYQGWHFLLETLRQAESEEVDFLGKAITPQIEERFTQLTQGRYGGLALGPDLDTDGIIVNGSKRSVTTLSVGTKEQLATLFRLALAERLKSTLLLDDQLVQSDDKRMDWFKKQLRASSQKNQIVVVTCRPEDYLELTEIPESGEAYNDVEEGKARVVNLTQVINHTAS